MRSSVSTKRLCSRIAARANRQPPVRLSSQPILTLPGEARHGRGRGAGAGVIDMLALVVAAVIATTPFLVARLRGCGWPLHRWSPWRRLNIHLVGAAGRDEGTVTDQSRRCERCGY